MALLGGFFQVFHPFGLVGLLLIQGVPIRRFQLRQLLPGICEALAGGLAEPLGGLGFVFFCTPAPGVGGTQPPLGRRVAAVRQAAEAALGGGEVLGRVKPPHHQLYQAWALLRLPLAAQGAGGGGGCYGEDRGVLFVVAGPVVPAGGANHFCVVLFITYRAFPHGLSSPLPVYCLEAMARTTTRTVCSTRRSGTRMVNFLCCVL